MISQSHQDKENTSNTEKESDIKIIALSLIGIVLFALAWLLVVQSNLESRPPPSPLSTPSETKTTTSTPSTPSVIEEMPHRKHIYAGIPKPLSSDSESTLLRNEGYWAGYSEHRKNPIWVAYRVFQTVTPKTFPRPSRFTTDSRTVAEVNHQAYTRSGYDRGHMAPNFAIASRHGRRAQLETFLMSNICPQKPLLNQGMWKHLEGRIANEYSNRLEEVWVVTGPIFDDERDTLASGVEIPDQFFKIIVDENSGVARMLAFIIPQEVQRGEQLGNFLTSVDIVEDSVNLDLFWQLEDGLENGLEAARMTAMW